MKLLPVQPFQETLHMASCAPATLKMLLTYWDLPGKERTDIDLGYDLGTDPDLGTTNEAFIAALPRFGLEADVTYEASFDDIARALESNIPVVVDWFSPGRADKTDSEMADGHYSIVVGLDDTHIAIQDPETGGLRTIERKDFYRAWFDFKHEYITTWDDMVVRWMAAVRVR